MEHYDIIIVGAGPAGIFASYRLAEHDLSILVVDRGKRAEERRCMEAETGVCEECSPCERMVGIGGSGLFSDGKLNLNPRIGGNLVEFTHSEKEAWDKISYVDDIFKKHGVAEEKVTDNKKMIDDLIKRAIQAGISFIPLRQRHIGSDSLPRMITDITEYLEKKKIRFMCSSGARRIAADNGRFSHITVNGEKIKGKYIILCPGRPGSEWLAHEAKRLGMRIKYNPIDIGVRVEVPAVVMNEVTAINWDPKFHIRTKTYDDFVRTFCTCPSGFVVEERYEEFVCVNGHSMRQKQSENTNFAFLTRIGLTEPVEDTIKYGMSIAKLAATIGGGRPILQRLADLRKGRRSTWSRLSRTYVEPTFKGVTPGDVSMALPQRVVANISEGLEMLDRVIPGVADDSTLIYAPEIKFHAMRIETNRNLETDMENIFVAGDGAGVSRGIIGAAVTGVLAAESILRKERLENQRYG